MAATNSIRGASAPARSTAQTQLQKRSQPAAARATVAKSGTSTTRSEARAPEPRSKNAPEPEPTRTGAAGPERLPALRTDSSTTAQDFNRAGVSIKKLTQKQATQLPAPFVMGPKTDDSRLLQQARIRAMR